MDGRQSWGVPDHYRPQQAQMMQSVYGMPGIVPQGNAYIAHDAHRVAQVPQISAPTYAAPGGQLQQFGGSENSSGADAITFNGHMQAAQLHQGMAQHPAAQPQPEQQQQVLAPAAPSRPPAPPPPPRRGPKKPAGTVTLQMLIEEGFIESGDDAVAMEYKGTITHAGLTRDGRIVWKDMYFDSPSAFSIYIKRLVNPSRKADDGWKTVKYAGKYLEAFKMELIKRRFFDRGGSLPGGGGATSDGSAGDGDEPARKRARTDTDLQLERLQQQQALLQRDPSAALYQAGYGGGYDGSNGRVLRRRARVPPKFGPPERTPNAGDPRRDIITCQPYGFDAAPFRLLVAPVVQLLMDFQAHLDRREVGGLLAGQWTSETGELKVERAFPVREAPTPTASGAVGGSGTSSNAPEFDADDETKVREAIQTDHRMKVVGWYRSRPDTAPQPTIADIEQQLTWQQQARTGSGMEPCVAALVGPYQAHPSGAARSTFTWFHVHRHTKPLVDSGSDSDTADADFETDAETDDEEGEGEPKQKRRKQKQKPQPGQQKQKQGQGQHKQPGQGQQQDVVARGDAVPGSLQEEPLLRRDTSDALIKAIQQLKELAEHYCRQPTRHPLHSPWHGAQTRLDRLLASIKSCLPPPFTREQKDQYASMVANAITAAALSQRAALSTGGGVGGGAAGGSSSIGSMAAAAAQQQRQSSGKGDRLQDVNDEELTEDEDDVEQPLPTASDGKPQRHDLQNGGSNQRPASKASNGRRSAATSGGRSCRQRLADTPSNDVS